jgi:predicted dehydrogenase
MMPLRMAVVGGGHLGRIHARLLSSIDDVQVVAVTDPSDASRSMVAEQLKLPTYASHSQIVDQVDAAIIASPSDLHFEIAADFLNAGKHLFVEKPLTISPEHARTLVRLARRDELTLQVGHVERFNPAWAAAADVTANAKYVEAIRASSFPGRCLDVGVVMDLMIHDIDLVLSLTSADLISVQASGLSVVSDHEDLAEARLTFACGLVANLKASRVSLTATRTMQVYGPNGFAEMDFSGPSVTMITPSPEVSERSLDLTSLGEPKGMRDQIFDKHLHVEQATIEPRNAILDELNDFVVSIGSGSEPTVSGSAGARAVEVADQVLAAIAERCWLGNAHSQPMDGVATGPHATLGSRNLRRAA